MGCAVGWLRERKRGGAKASYSLGGLYTHSRHQSIATHLQQLFVGWGLYNRLDLLIQTRGVLENGHLESPARRGRSYEGTPCTSLTGLRGNTGSAPAETSTQHHCPTFWRISAEVSVLLILAANERRAPFPELGPGRAGSAILMQTVRCGRSKGHPCQPIQPPGGTGACGWCTRSCAAGEPLPGLAGDRANSRPTTLTTGHITWYLLNCIINGPEHLTGVAATRSGNLSAFWLAVGSRLLAPRGRESFPHSQTRSVDPRD